MPEHALNAESSRTTPPPTGDTFFGSLQQSRARVPQGRRALAGPRNADEWVELTYEELMGDILTVSTHLSALGLRRGDVLCLLLPNWTEAVIYTYAASRLGAVICPITTIYRQRELSFILKRTECKVIVVPSVYRGFDYAAMVRELADSLPALQHVICVGDTQTEGVLSSKDFLQATTKDLTPPPVSGDDIAVLAFTSGTTGEPKGVMHSHASMHAAIDDFVGHAGFGSGLTSLVMSPFGHLTGFIWGVLMPLRGSGDVVMLEIWDPERALDLIARYSVTFTMGATPFLRDLLDAARERSTDGFPDMFVCAGAPIPPTLIERAVQLHDCRVVSGWGMSEYPIGTSTAVTDDPTIASRSDGRPAGRADVVIVDSDGAPVAIGQEGDLIIRGPGLFKGYYKRPDLDADAFTPDGLLKTGDRARLLDHRGHIRICGRTKDIIIRGGENIPVVEIENILLTHPAIKEIALVALPHDRLGETACACVVLQPTFASYLTVEELGQFLGRHGVAKQFWPEAIRVMPELPRTPSGKIQKFALRDQVLSHPGHAGDIEGRLSNPAAPRVVDETVTT
jgi:cyclohexanecarboxylate-CoA ligase